MGKKRVYKQSEEDLLKEVKAGESGIIPAKEKAPEATGGKKIVKGEAHIFSSYNNTIVTITDSYGNVLAWASAGSAGFKGTKKSTSFAAAKVVDAVLEKLKNVNLQELSVFVKGVGAGRESAIRSLAVRGIEISSIKDVTPIPHNGCRPPKVRRV